MSYDYVIRNFDKTFGQLIIEYRNQKICFDLPIKDDNTYPVGDELNQAILSILPVWHFQRIDRIASGILNESEIESLVVPYPEPEPEPESDLINIEQEQQPL